MNSKSTNGPGLKHVLDGYTVLDFTHAREILLVRGHGEFLREQKLQCHQRAKPGHKYDACHVDQERVEIDIRR